MVLACIAMRVVAWWAPPFLSLGDRSPQWVSELLSVGNIVGRSVGCGGVAGEPRSLAAPADDVGGVGWRGVSGEREIDAVCVHGPCV